MRKKIVFLQGAFDIINWGHIQSFKVAKSYGDYLIIGLNSNELIRLYKQRDAVLPWYQKRDIIKACRYVDKVVKAEAFSPIELLKKYDVDVYCIGDEWTSTKKIECKYMASKPSGEVKILPRFPGTVPTSQIKQILLKEAKQDYSKNYYHEVGNGECLFCTWDKPHSHPLKENIDILLRNREEKVRGEFK